MIIYDFEVYRYDWLVCWIDTETRKNYYIVNDTEKFKKFYEHYRNKIWVGYNSRYYDKWIAKALLCGFNPYEVSDWIINKDRMGHEFSSLLNNITILDYDCMVFSRSLKQLEAFMGHDIRETEIPFDIDRKLTPAEIKKVIKYCTHDVNETLEVFVETKADFEEHMALLKEFNLPLKYVSKTATQLTSIILGATLRKRTDEFDIRFPDTLKLNKYSYIKERFEEWSINEKNYETLEFTTDILGVPHKFGVGGIHGAKEQYYEKGIFLMADVSSYYSALMIEYDMLSRNVYDKKKFVKIRDKRIEYKNSNNPKHKPLKLVLNKTYGGSKDKFNNLYDPLQANNVCISGQLLLVDLLEKLEGHCDLIQSNTDGVLLKVNTYAEVDKVKQICVEWCKRVRMDLEFDEIKQVVQKDVNAYLVVFKNGKIKRKGTYIKQLSKLDYDLPIVNEAVTENLLNGTPVERTIYNCNEMIKFQKVTKIGKTYSHCVHNNKVLTTKVNRVFASKNQNDGTLYKKKCEKVNLEKVANTPERCFIDNDNIVGKLVPSYLDKEWYIELAKARVIEFYDKD